MDTKTDRKKEPTSGKGRKAEALACRLLQEKGFRILSRNYRCRVGEIDIVAEAAGQLIFVEVRSLGPSARHLPEETINRTKQQRLSKVALAYIQANRMEDRSARFDVVAVENTMGSAPTLRHLPDAFEIWEP